MINHPNTYDKRIIRLNGCVRIGAETIVFMECDRGYMSASEVIWLDQLESVKLSEEVFKKKEIWTEPKLVSKDEIFLVKKLLSNPVGSVVRATIEGEFQTSVTRKFGHLNDFEHRLIIHRALATEKPLK